VKEASKYIKVNQIIPKPANYNDIASEDTWNPFSKEALYVYYCDNEIIHGVEFPQEPAFLDKVPETIPVICDASSNIMSRSIDFSKLGIVFAGAQKNLGCSGVTVVIVRDDLVDFAAKITPTILHYKTQVQSQSLYNTPSTFSIYILNLMLKWIKQKGGVDAMSKLSDQKSKMLYDAIDNSNGFYQACVIPKYRSRMNVTWKLNDTVLEQKFLKEAAKENFLCLNGHRSVGGLRASLYNAITIEEVQCLINFMTSFAQENGSK